MSEPLSSPAAPPGPSQQQRGADNLRGMAWAFAAAILVVAMVAMIKEVTQGMPTMQLVFFRMLFVALIWLPWAMRGRFAGFKTKRPAMHLLRSVCGFTSFALMTYAISRLKLADATVLSFSVPLWMIPISYVVLREVADMPRIVATFVGFVGVIMIVRPSLDTDPAMFAAIGSAIVTCITMISVKQLMKTDPPGTIILYYGITGVVLSAIPAWLEWQAPSLLAIALLIAASAAASAGQYCLAKAYQAGDTTVVAPVNFSRLPMSLIAGLLIFGEWPDDWSVAGMMVILLATIVISLREARAKGRAARAAAE